VVPRPGRKLPDLNRTSVVKTVGDRKPKKNSSGNADAHKAKAAKDKAGRDASGPKAQDKKDGGKK